MYIIIIEGLITEIKIIKGELKNTNLIIQLFFSRNNTILEYEIIRKKSDSTQKDKYKILTPSEEEFEKKFSRLFLKDFYSINAIKKDFIDFEIIDFR